MWAIEWKHIVLNYVKLILSTKRSTERRKDPANINY